MLKIVWYKHDIIIKLYECIKLHSFVDVSVLIDVCMFSMGMHRGENNGCGMLKC